MAQEEVKKMCATLNGFKFYQDFAYKYEAHAVRVRWRITCVCVSASID